MQLSEVETILTSPLDIITERFPGVRVYVFGSILRAEGLCGDIDILVVYETSERVEMLAEVFEEACSRLPLHFTWMTASEEKELEFIEQQKAVNIRSIISKHRMPNTRHDRSRRSGL